MTYLDIKLRVEAQKEEYPKKYLRNLQTIHEVRKTAPDNWLERAMLRIVGKNASDRTKESYISRVSSYADSMVTDHEEVKEYLRLSMALLEGCGRNTEFRGLDIFKELLYYTIRNTPYENEEYIREKSEELIPLLGGCNEAMLLKIYERLLEILYDHNEYELAEQKLVEAKNTIRGNRSPYVWGQWYYILAGYYDSILNGHYDAESEDEKQIVGLLLESVNKAIRCMKRSRTGDAGILLGEYYRLKALVLIRSGIGKNKEIQLILEKIKNLIEKYAQPNSRFVRDYYMTRAWYYTYYERDCKKVYAYLDKASDITNVISITELDKVDELYCPMANIFFELQQYEDAEAYLLLSISICEKHQEIEAYQRRQTELLSYLLQIYFDAEEDEKCRAAILALDERARQSGGSGIEQLIPIEIREAVCKQKTTDV